MKYVLASLALMSTVALSACGTTPIETYKDQKPALVLEDYFKGDSKAWGVFQDRFGAVRRSFVVDIHGVWDAPNQTLTLTEDFVYNDGEKEQRLWTIKKTGDNTYEGTAGGVVGIAKGRTSGNAFEWKYTFNLPVSGAIWKVKFDDWMFLQPDGQTLFNKATITRFGFRLGDVYIFFKKNENTKP